MVNNEFDIKVNPTTVAYLMKGLECLNRSGVSLQESANIIGISNMINAELKKSAEDGKEPEIDPDTVVN